MNDAKDSCEIQRKRLYQYVLTHKNEILINYKFVIDHKDYRNMQMSLSLS
jgi:hypothetical protein